MLLAEKKLRKTNQRKVILETLLHDYSHPTADQIYEKVRKYLPRISLGTVYRNLEILSEGGVIQKLDLGGTQKRYDGNPLNHYHIKCIQCERIDDVHRKPIRAIRKAFTGMDGYQVLDYHLEFLGICPACQKKKKGVTYGT